MKESPGGLIQQFLTSRWALFLLALMALQHLPRINFRLHRVTGSLQSRVTVPNDGIDNFGSYVPAAEAVRPRVSLICLYHQ
jgi:hypothetical protein